MSKVVYWMSVSLDGFIGSRDGKIDWTAPDDEFRGGVVMLRYERACP